MRNVGWLSSTATFSSLQRGNPHRGPVRGCNVTTKSIKPNLFSAAEMVVVYGGPHVPIFVQRLGTRTHTLKCSVVWLYSRVTGSQRPSDPGIQQSESAKRFRSSSTEIPAEFEIFRRRLASKHIVSCRNFHIMPFDMHLMSPTIFYENVFSRPGLSHVRTIRPNRTADLMGPPYSGGKKLRVAKYFLPLLLAIPN